jgi:hypothetical protein
MTDEDEKGEKVGIFFGWWNITPHFSKRKNGIWTYQKWKKNKVKFVFIL